MEGTRAVFIEGPMEETGLAELILEEAETFDDAGPSPAVVAGCEDIDLEDVAGFRTVDPHGAGEGMNAGAIDGEVVGCRHAGPDLAATGVDTLEVDFVARSNMQARREGAIPDGVGGLC